jgi:hypothetical protein
MVFDAVRVRLLEIGVPPTEFLRAARHGTATFDHDLEPLSQPFTASLRASTAGRIDPAARIDWRRG